MPKVYCTILEKRENAIWIKQSQKGKEVRAWIPKSQCSRINDNKGITKDEIDIPAWLANEKELEYV